MKKNTSQPDNRKKVFVSHARILTDDQRQSLSDKERAFEASCNDRGGMAGAVLPGRCLFHGGRTGADSRAL